jgi:hypothetical protein
VNKTLVALTAAGIAAFAFPTLARDVVDRKVAASVPDPASVERFGPAYRYPQAGWTVLHIEGEPYDRGYQHGRLMANEIAAIVHAEATYLSPKGAEDGWRRVRTLVDALFLRRYDAEYVLEMKGIADGAAAAGAKFDGRSIDLVDVVCVNAWTELEYLEDALRATPTGVEGIKFPDLGAMNEHAPAPGRCSAFIANGPATRDGKIVIGHITMWELYPGTYFNVWLDVKPTKGHRVLLQGFPGGIQSSLDYYMNDAGMLVAETTLDQTSFKAEGATEASRIRRAVQYGDSIASVCSLLAEKNNGLYTNEWLVGDTKTNEIAMFELGTEKSRLYRSSQDEWFGDTPGFYWGCNNAKDMGLRLETVTSLEGRPQNVVFHPEDRDLIWQDLYRKHKGEIDASFGFEAFATPRIAASRSIDAKVTTTDLARDLKTYGLFGPPMGRTWEPTPDDRAKFSDVKPFVSSGWTLLDARPPEVAPIGSRAIDLGSVTSAGSGVPTALVRPARDEDSAPGPAWHGTILPAGGGDVWLATAFADYERIVSQVKGSESFDGSLAQAATDPSSVALFPYRVRYLAAARHLPATSLASIKPAIDKDDWYELAAGKGPWVLAELRGRLGSKFEEAMDAFGRAHAGKEVSTADLRAALESGADESLETFFDERVKATGIPRLELREVKVEHEETTWKVTGAISQPDVVWHTRVEVSLETVEGPVVHEVALEGAESSFELVCHARPTSIAIDPRHRLLTTNGPRWSVTSFQNDLEHTLIVHGTGAEGGSLEEAARILQGRIANQWSNYRVPIKADTDVTADEIKSNHLVLIGRPAVNTLTARFAKDLPVTLGTGSFTVAGETYAHPQSGFIASAANPENEERSIVVYAGLGAESTRRLVSAWTQPCEVLLVPVGGGARPLVLPSKDLVLRLAAP